MTRIRMYLWESMIVPKNRIFHNFPIRGQNKGSQSMSETFYLCEHCLADNELREEVRSRGEIIDKCPICQSTGGRAMPVTDSMVRRIFRALVRLNYSEWDYNHHIGGESLQSLVFGGHEIFDLNEKASELAFEGVFLLLEEEWYPEKSEDISLGGGYWDGGILAGLRDRLDPSFENILHHALKINYFELEEYIRLSTVETMRDCPVCAASAELWEYSPNGNHATKVVMCSHGELFGPQSGIIGEGCLLYMPPDDFYQPTKREAIKYWNDYAQALERMRRNRNWEKHKAGVLREAGS